MSPGPAWLNSALGAIAAVLLAALSGCQHASSSGPGQVIQPWRVLERVGDVRSTTDIGRERQSLRPGDRINDGRVLTTGKGGLVILAANGVQLTAGENSSIRLSAPTAVNLTLDHGWLRVRIATAANREARVKTKDFDIHASNTTLTLRADKEGTDLSVDAGSAVLASTDGRHRATLVAGAAAKIDRTVNDKLMIRRASGQSFNTVTPFSGADPENNQTSPHSARIDPDGTDLLKPIPATVPMKVESPMIRPASRINKDGVSRANTSPPIRNANAIVLPAISPQKSSADPFGVLTAGNVASPLSSEGENEPRPTDTMHEKVGEIESLQQQFDLLTEGLTEGL